MTTVLAIETSCDETAVAIVTSEKKILANVIWSQIDLHAKYGGVVPEIAARSHIAELEKLVQQALAESKLTWKDIDLIAATSGPGLIGGLVVGLMLAKGLALSLDKPFLAVNHLEGHALTARLSNHLEYPYLLLLVSGGHTQLILVEGLGEYTLLGTTIDDALGEAFDKLAKMVGLPYPGGPIVEKLAKNGNASHFRLPLSQVGQPHANFSFSGIKTAMKRIIDAEKVLTENLLSEKFISDLCASFQVTAGTIILDRLLVALTKARAIIPELSQLVIAGGVGANQYLRTAISDFATKHGCTLTAPPMNLCTDNAAMIGWAALERFSRGEVSTFEVEPKSSWPLTDCKT